MKVFRSDQPLSRVRLFATPWITARQASLSPPPRVHSDSCPSSQWCHPAISSSVVPFSSCPQSLPASETFPRSQLFTWGGQSTGVSANVQLFVTLWTVALQDPPAWDSPGKNTGVSSHSLVQGIFLTHQLNPSLLPCRLILCHLSHCCCCC